MKYSMTIRMGAAHWDASVHQKNGSSALFNFRTMDRDDRRRWYGAFMSSVRKMYRRDRFTAQRQAQQGRA
jgi:hypothetical protein